VGYQCRTWLWPGGVGVVSFILSFICEREPVSVRFGWLKGGVVSMWDRYGTVRKGVVRSHEHPPCSASTRLGNLWGESSKLEFLIGPSAYRLAGGCS
jgi:hypothetical protein